MPADMDDDRRFVLVCTAHLQEGLEPSSSDYYAAHAARNPNEPTVLGSSVRPIQDSSYTHYFNASNNPTYPVDGRNSPLRICWTPPAIHELSIQAGQTPDSGCRDGVKTLETSGLLHCRGGRDLRR